MPAKFPKSQLQGNVKRLAHLGSRLGSDEASWPARPLFVAMPLATIASALLLAVACTAVGEMSISCELELQGKVMDGAAECIPSWARDETKERAWRLSGQTALSIKNRSKTNLSLGWLANGLAPDSKERTWALTCAKPLPEFPNACSASIGVADPDDVRSIKGYFYIALYAFSKDVGEVAAEGFAVRQGKHGAHVRGRL